MSEVAYLDKGKLTDPEDITRVWRERINEAREDRKKQEPTWLSNLAFVAGKHWLQWDRFSRQLALPDELEDRELYTAPIIGEHRAAALGELQSDEDRPEVALAQEGERAEQLAEQINNGVEHGWDYEWRGDEILLDARRKTLDLGVSAILPYFDPTVGPVLEENVPHYQGKPVFDNAKVAELMQDGPRPDVQMRQVQAGAIRWRPLSAFNLLVPPGIVHERDFPYEITVMARPLDQVQQEFGDKAKGLKEDGDIGSALGMSSKESQPTDAGEGGAKQSRLRGHVWVYTCYERPCPNYPNGRVVTLAGNDMRLLDVRDELPCKAPDGTYNSGLVYLHWWRLTDRFWSLSLIENLKDAQRAINGIVTDSLETIRRGLPFMVVEEGSGLEERKGTAMEILSTKKGTQSGQPVISQGLGPGQWMLQWVEALREAASHASTLNPLRFGENPQNIDTYSQLALLNENEQAKRKHILSEHRETRRRLVESSVYYIRTYWGAEKQILVAGPDDKLQAQTFNASQIPDFYVVRIARGSAIPDTQGASLKKIEELWQAWLASANPAGPLPDPSWLQESLDAGEALPLPEQPRDIHTEKARYENDMMSSGEDVQPAYYDDHAIHMPIHREREIEAEMAGDVETQQREEMHIQMHGQLQIQAEQQQAEVMAQQAQAQAEQQQAAHQQQTVTNVAGEVAKTAALAPFQQQNTSSTSTRRPA